MNRIAAFQEELTGALIGLARATKGNEDLITTTTNTLLREGLSATAVNTDTSDVRLHDLLQRVAEEKKRIVPDCAVCLNPCGRTENYDIRKFQTAPEEIRSLKSLILFCIRELASCACRAAQLGHNSDEVDRFFYQALFILGFDHWTAQQYLSFLEEIGRIHLQCMDLLHQNDAR